MKKGGPSNNKSKETAKKPILTKSNTTLSHQRTANSPSKTSKNPPSSSSAHQPSSQKHPQQQQSTNHSNALRAEDFDAMLKAFEKAAALLCEHPSNDKIVDARSALSKLQNALIVHGLPSSSSSPLLAKTSENPSLRGRLWKLFIALPATIDADEYVKLVRVGKKDREKEYAKIRGDSFRTFPKEQHFQELVKEEQIIRTLMAFVQQYAQTPSTDDENKVIHIPLNRSPYRFTYCQGMNAIAACMLSCMPEPDAFFSFCQLITTHIPLYYLSSHIGVEAGCKLIDEILHVVDDELAQHLGEYRINAYVYAFHAVSSLCASIPPFSELLSLWDFLLCFGPQLIPLCVVAQVVVQRSALLASEQPKEILDYRKWPRLNARLIIDVTMSMLNMIPNDLMEKIHKHARDPDVAAKITGRTPHFTQT